MDHSLLCFVSVVVLMVPCSAQTTWWQRLGFRSLLQDTTEQESAGADVRSFNVSCTWADSIGCYLDYFDHLPDSEIKEYYRIDENCRRIANETACKESTECTWTKLVDEQSADGCYVAISDKDVDRCSKTRKRRVIRGSMCDVWKGMNRCKRLSSISRQRCETFETAETKCTWDSDNCFLSQHSLVRLEFVDQPADADYVIDMQERCETAPTREDCEQFRTMGS